ncbi:MAG: hypothetical protein CV087_17430 [Candidatus Brocadia sp. WS118]|nr:MAG: hypothetical protein CV087_17430 [Candidatus Brocadia sp. WS118]
MTKVQKIKDDIHNFLWWAGIVGKVVMFQVGVALMVMGVLYITNFKITIEPLVKVISPIGGN